jgi:hypothetical protein
MTDPLLLIVVPVAAFCVGFVAGTAWSYWWNVGSSGPIPPELMPRDEPIPPPPAGFRIDRSPVPWWNSDYAPKPKPRVSPNREALKRIWLEAKREQMKTPVEYQIVPPPAARKTRDALPSINWGAKR